MIIQSGVEPRIIDDYDVLFTNGHPLPFTVDKAEGDSIEFFDDRIVVSLASRSAPSDSAIKMPPETHTIYKSNILLISHRQRTLYPLSPEQRDEVQELIKQKVSKTIH
jgi:hypothetical protein